MNLKKVWVIAGLAATPFAAIAECPTAADLDAGGVVFTVDGEPELHYRAPNGLIVIDGPPEDDGYFFRTITAHGVHLVQLQDIEGGRVQLDMATRYLFETPVTELPAPVPNATFQVNTQLLEGFSPSGQEVVSHEWGDLMSQTIGTCTYDAVPVRATYVSDDDTYAEELVYLPDLGTALFVAYVEGDTVETYSYTDIRAK